MIPLIQDLATFLGLPIPLGPFDVAGILSVGFVLMASLGVFLAGLLSQKDPKPSIPTPSKAAPTHEGGEEEIWRARLRRGMERTRGHFWGRLSTLFSQKGLSPEALEEMEEILYEADLGPATTESVIEELKSKFGGETHTLDEIKELILGLLDQKMRPVQSLVPQDFLSFSPSSPGHSPEVIMVVGVNGVGKTTTVGKLAAKLSSQGAKVVVGACDTFRMAAVHQLELWCERAGCEMVRGKDGGDPSGVGHGALQKAMEEKAHYCLLDTAGRLHTKDNLMEQLKKSKRVLGKLDPKAPHHTLLVLDAVTGQNAMGQAHEFHRALGLTGIILTKCDSSSKAGPAVAIVEQLGIPITHIGVGEGVDDLDRFRLEEYLDAIIH
ncbi:MAG: signal recognition particle-docking protein FtsY [Bacteriovoracales bacterium]|nr:signal recognition particle-docking protein FtsY [Bacteriovoracales bacterium]